MINKRKTLADHVDHHLRWLNVIASVAISVVVAVSVAVLSISAKEKEARLTVSVIREHLATLVEIQDGPEIQRLLTSITRGHAFNLFVIDDGMVIGSSRAVSDLRRPPTFKLDGASSGFLRNTFIVSEKLTRSNGPDLNAKIVLIEPFTSITLISVGAGVLIFLLSLIIARGYVILTRRVLNAALKPMDLLNEAIIRLGELKIMEPINEFGILELDQIRKTVMKTQRELLAARERLAGAIAKEWASDAYRRLIHDLHTLVACLGSVSASAQANPEDEIIQKDAKVRIPRLAEQILAQLSAAAKNADFEDPKFMKEDLRAPIREAKELVSHIYPDAIIELELPAKSLPIFHDRVLMTRAVTNLVKNAVEAGATNVKVAIVDDEQIAIRVEDNGPGMKEREVSLFLKGRGQSRKHDRFAIGLSTVNHIIRSHGGTATYQRSSTLGGSIFELRFKDNAGVMVVKQGVAING